MFFIGLKSTVIGGGIEIYLVGDDVPTNYIKFVPQGRGHLLPFKAKFLTEISSVCLGGIVRLYGRETHLPLEGKPLVSPVFKMAFDVFKSLFFYSADI